LGHAFRNGLPVADHVVEAAGHRLRQPAHGSVQSQNRRISRTNGLTAGGQPNQDLNSATNFIVRRAYVNDGCTIGPIFLTDDKMNTWRTWYSARTRQENTLDSFQASTVANIWKDRITFVGGVRRDFFQSRGSSAVIDTPVTVTAANQASYPNFPVGSIVGTREVIRMGPQLMNSRANATTKSAGATFFPIKAVGGYYNYSETFNTQGTSANGSSLDGTKQYGTTRGKGWNTGLRLQFGQRQTRGIGRLLPDQEAGIASSQGVTEINALWNAIGLTSTRSIVG